MRFTFARASIVLPLFVSAGCHDKSPTAPVAFDPPGIHGSRLYQVGGTGWGGVSVTPQAVPEAFFTASIKVRLHGAKPNTLYTVQRAPEIGRTLESDGSCQRAMGVSPWSSSDPAAASFLTFAQPGGSTPVTLTTSAAGDASLDFSFSAATIPAGTRFDVMFRMLDDLGAPTSVFLSGCFTVTVL